MNSFRNDLCNLAFNGQKFWKPSAFKTTVRRRLLVCYCQRGIIFSLIILIFLVVLRTLYYNLTCIAGLLKTPCVNSAKISCKTYIMWHSCCVFLDKICVIYRVTTIIFIKAFLIIVIEVITVSLYNIVYMIIIIIPCNTFFFT